MYLRLSEINRVGISENIVVPLTLKKAVIIFAETLEDLHSTRFVPESSR
jgi:hypothetical protein